MEKLFRELILFHVIGINDIQHDQDGKLGGDHIAVVQVPEGRQEHDLVAELFEDAPVLGGEDDGFGAPAVCLLEQVEHVLLFPADADPEYQVVPVLEHGLHAH